MNVMNMPGFTAESSLYANSGFYRQTQLAGSGSDTVVPAIPFCGNCDYILDRCAENGGRPRALCHACAVGNCFSGVEVPPPDDPFPWRPRW